MTTGQYAFEPLGTQDRAVFSCGDDALDRYFRQQVGQDQRRRVASCFILVDRQSRAIAGYYTLSAASIETTELPEAFTKRLPRYPNLPAILLGRLAVDSRYQGRGLGRLLLVDALRRARDAASQVAAVVILVDAKGEAAAGFYESFGFARVQTDPLRLYLPIATIRDL